MLISFILLCSSEKWTLKETDKKRLRVFEMAVLRRIARVTRRDQIRNDSMMNDLIMKKESLTEYNNAD